MTVDELKAENEELRWRLEEAEETLRAIRTGAVDAVVVGDPGSLRVYTLDGADRAYRVWVEQMSQGAATLASDGTVAYCNLRLSTLLATPSEALLGQPIDRFLEPEDRPRYAELLRKGRSSVGEGEFSLARADDGTVPVLLTLNALPPESGAAVGVLVTDLTAQKRHDELAAALAALRETEERFRTLADAIPQLAWMARPDGSIFWYNRRWYDYTGMTPEAVEGWGWQSVHDPAELPRVMERWRVSIETGEPFDMVFPLRGADGVFRPFLTRIIAVKDAEGRVTQWFGTNTDVTEAKRAEADANAAKAAAEAANRMKDVFLATLSHELRTPLNAILGWAKVIQSRRLSADDVAEGLRAIERNSRIQAQLIEDLLDVSRIIAGNFRLDVQRVQLPVVIEAAVSAVVPAADAKGVRIHKVLDSLAGPVSGDPARLQQVVWNLVSNAVKFTPKGGRVQVVLERVNSHVEVSVIDTGQGIKPEFLPFVFDRFRQADASTTRRHGGLGLGLSIVKQLVEMHGGTVRAKSPGEQQGATFTVALPIMVVHQEEPAVEKVPPRVPEVGELEAPADSLAGVKVLVVDDEPDARALLRRVLSDSGSEVRVAESVAEALRVLEEFRPDVLVSDIGMPDQDGYDLMNQIRAAGRTSRQMPAVALTAFARAEDRKRAMLAGFQTHVAKPVDPAELVAIVASLAGRTGGA